MSNYFDTVTTDPRTQSGVETYPVGMLLSVVVGNRAYMVHKQGVGVWVEINPYKIDSEDLVRAVNDKADAKLMSKHHAEMQAQINLLTKTITELKNKTESDISKTQTAINLVSTSMIELKNTLSELSAKSDKDYITSVLESVKVHLAEETRKIVFATLKGTQDTINEKVSREVKRSVDQAAAETEKTLKFLLDDKAHEIKEAATQTAKETLKTALGSFRV